MDVWRKLWTWRTLVEGDEKPDRSKCQSMMDVTMLCLQLFKLTQRTVIVVGSITVPTAGLQFYKFGLNCLTT